jgi:hypothetical protein
MSVTNNLAFVGVSFSNKIIFNIATSDGDLEYTGLSIIEMLKKSNNAFVTNIFDSQSFDSIEILGPNFLLGNYVSEYEKNLCNFKELQVFMNENNNMFYYIYDYEEDLILIKTPLLNNMVALDYKVEEDVEKFTNNNKRKVS